MTPKPRRPITIWITQGIMLLFALANILGLVQMARALTNYDDTVKFLGVRYTVVILTLSFGVAVAASIAFEGMVRRKSYGRWFAVGLFALYCIVASFGLIRNLGSGTLSVASPTDIIRVIILAFVFLLIPVSLILLLLFKPSVKRFFAPATEVPFAEPPGIEYYAKDIKTGK